MIISELHPFPYCLREGVWGMGYENVRVQLSPFCKDLNCSAVDMDYSTALFFSNIFPN